MSRATVAKRETERAHVTVDSGMGSFYQWFATYDRRYRARELVKLARLGFEGLEQRGSVSSLEPVQTARHPSVQPATAVREDSDHDGPDGFEELLSFGEATPESSK